MTPKERIDHSCAVSTPIDTNQNRSKLSDFIGKIKDGRQSTPKSNSNTESTKKYSFQNWSGNQQSNPAKIFNPTTLEELIEIVHLAKANNKIIRCASGGYSLSGSSVVNDEGYLVVMKKMNRISKPVHVSDSLWTVEIETGVSVKELDYLLRCHDPPLALPSNIAATSLCYGGIITLGCHGAGTNARTMADHVHEVKIVDSTGTLNTFTKEKDPLEFSAAALNLGLLGIIYTYTLKVEPMFTLLMRDTSPPLDYYLGSAKIGGPRLKAMVLGNDQTQIFYNPFFATKTGSEKVWFKEWNRTNLPVVESRIKTKFKRLSELCGLSICNHIIRIVLKRPEATPFIARTLFNTTSMNKQEILYASEALHFLGGIERVPFCCCEMSIKMDENFENVVNAWNFVVEQVREYAKQKAYPLNLMLEMRFIKSSPLLMSNVYDDDPEAIFCMIELISVAGTEGFDEFMEKIGQYWMENFNAQPHWAKDWEKLPGIYPHIRNHGGARFDQFDAIRRKYDPEDMFMNKIFAGVLGH
ncbi:hypothetical protein BGX26_008460 [Mortierella sp. AD094]|nr:hypothetical protein BGX26_008460 [Mortierella sp. AD094]